MLNKYQDNVGSYGWTCFTCGAEHLVGSNCQLGHFIPRGTCGAYLRFSLDNLRIQCYHCNINLGGNGAVFYRRLLETEGKKFVDKLFKDKNKTVKAYDHYVELLDKYKTM